MNTITRSIDQIAQKIGLLHTEVSSSSLVEVAPLKVAAAILEIAAAAATAATTIVEPTGVRDPRRMIKLIHERTKDRF